MEIVTKSEDGTLEILPLVIDSLSLRSYSAIENSFSAEKFKTYKRRRHAGPLAPCSKLPLLEATRRLCESSHETGGHDTLKSSKYQKDASANRQSHWAHFLDSLSQNLEPSSRGMQSCILDTLAGSTVDSSRQHDPLPHQGNWWQSKIQLKGCPSLKIAHKDNHCILDDLLESRDENFISSTTQQCQHIFRGIITSDAFVSLCGLICENFHSTNAEGIFNFNHIDSRMRNGEYEQSASLFASDIQQGWDNLKKIGEEMIHLANSLSKLSQSCFHDQVMEQDVTENMQLTTSEVKGIEEASQAESTAKNSMDTIIRRDPSDDDGQLTKLEESEPCLNCVGVCKACGLKTATIFSLICDSCEAMFHISCIEPLAEGVPTKNWFCNECVVRIDSEQFGSKHSVVTTSHKHCAVCERLAASDTGIDETEGAVEPIIVLSDSEESQDYLIGNPTLLIRRGRKAKRTCKRCMLGVPEGKGLFTCEHVHCPFKFYHRHCLTELESRLHTSVWYCPSCLCRRCLLDKDDDKVVLCDGCDEAYHTYCMIPPRSSIPRERWYCVFCKIKMRMKKYRYKLKARIPGASSMDAHTVAKKNAN